MVANHLLQLLTLTAMEPPVAFDADSVREEKVQVLRSIRRMTPDQVEQRTVRGQYGPGEIDREKVVAYREEEGVKKESTTETYAAVEFRVSNWRWSGVPFYVRTGSGSPATWRGLRVISSPPPRRCLRGQLKKRTIRIISACGFSPK